MQITEFLMYYRLKHAFFHENRKYSHHTDKILEVQRVSVEGEVSKLLFDIYLKQSLEQSL